MRDVLIELRDGQKALHVSQANGHLETSTRLARLEERMDRSRADDLEIKARLQRVETAEHVSVDWMRKVEERGEKNEERIEELAQQRGFLVGVAAAVSWVLMFLSALVKAWLPAVTGK